MGEILRATHPITIVKKQIQAFAEWQEMEKNYLNKMPNLSDTELEVEFTSIFEKFKNKCRSLAEATSSLDDNDQEELKKIIQQSSIINLSTEAPLFRQIIGKPRGYAGDAQVMQYMYDNEFVGDTNFKKIWHKIAASVITAETVRKRKKLLISFFQNYLSEGSNVLSLAAGPAFEIKEFLEKTSLSNVNFKAVDHDIQTLKESLSGYKDKRLEYYLGNAFKILKGERKILIPHKALLNVCNPKKDMQSYMNWKTFLKYKIKNLQENSFDFVYSSGLYDYIKTTKNVNRGAIALTTKLFDLVKPNGILLIGNFSNQGPEWIRWHMKYVCNWELIYRDDEQIREFAKGINPDAIKEIKILEEETGINKFLMIRKKGN